MPLNPTSSPRTYRLAPSTRWFGIIVGGSLVAGFPVAAWALLKDGARDAGSLIAVALCLLLACFGAYWLLCVSRAKMVLTADMISVLDPILPTRTLRREEIAGREAIAGRGGPVGVKLIPNRTGLKAVRIVDGTYESDSALVAWLTALPDLDAAEEEASVEAIVSDPALGPSREVRLAKLQAAVGIAAKSHWLVLGALVACVFYPKPPGILLFVLAAMPWAAIWWVSRSGGLYRLSFKRNAEYGDLSSMLTLPGLGLSIVSLGDVHFEDATQWVLPSALIAAVLVGAAAWADPWCRKFSSATVFQAIFLLAYGSGAFALADTRLDMSVPQVYRTVVRAERYSSGRRSNSYYLMVAPWGPRKHAAEVKVPWSLYRLVNPRDTVCVSLLAGAARVPWYAVDLCR